MEEEAENPNPIYISTDLVEEILLRLPLKSVLRFKTVSKQWRSILESKTFLENRMNLQNSRKILAAYTCCHPGRVLPEPSLSEGDEEIVYLQCDHVRGFPMSCDGMVCFVEKFMVSTVETCRVHVLNTSTRQIRQIPWGNSAIMSSGTLPFWRVGFGRDKVTGSFKVVKMRLVEECEVLDVGIGEWRKLMSSPPYKVDNARISVCVNGSIYWLIFSSPIKLLALNLHTEEFHDVSIPTEWITWFTQLMNLEDHLAFSRKKEVGLELFLEIWSMDTYQEQWSKTYSINLAGLTHLERLGCFNRVTVSKSGNVFLSHKDENCFFRHGDERFFKYYPKTDEIRCLPSNICDISPYIENLISLPSEPDHRPCSKISKVRPCSKISKLLKRIKLKFLAFCRAF